MPSPAQHSPDEERTLLNIIHDLIVDEPEPEVGTPKWYAFRNARAALAAAEREEQSLATERDEWRDRAQRAERRLAETQDRIERLVPPQREGEGG